MLKMFITIYKGYYTFKQNLMSSSKTVFAATAAGDENVPSDLSLVFKFRCIFSGLLKEHHVGVYKDYQLLKHKDCHKVRRS